MLTLVVQTIVLMIAFLDVQVVPANAVQAVLEVVVVALAVLEVVLEVVEEVVQVVAVRAMVDAKVAVKVGVIKDALAKNKKTMQKLLLIE